MRRRLFRWSALVSACSALVAACGGSSGRNEAASNDAGGAGDGADGGRDADASGGLADAGPDGPAGWVLTWSDEFDGPNGAPPDPKKWALQTGGDGWGNEELEYYTTSLANAQQKSGDLVITATTEGASAYTCSYPMNGNPCEYTSARLQTEGLFAQEYGRFEARIQLPAGQGLWPAFWTLGDNIGSVGWPTCGEIDIMENIGKTPGTNYGSLHGVNSSTKMAYENITAPYTLPGGARLSDAFHVYAIEWEPATIRFYVDEYLYQTQTQAGLPSGYAWPFDQPFFLVVNVAVGGSWPGSPDATTVLPQTMLVDYVRVYSRADGEP